MEPTASLALELCYSNPDAQKVHTLLQDPTLDINKLEYGTNALATAILWGSLNSAYLVLEHPNINLLVAATDTGQTPIRLALSKYSWAKKDTVEEQRLYHFIEALLRKGAHPHYDGAGNYDRWFWIDEPLQKLYDKYHIEPFLEKKDYLKQLNKRKKGD